jgi:hypothetical protein
MPVVTFLLSIVVSLLTPFKRKRRTSKHSPNRRFYKHGFMADEIEALQSIFHSDDVQRSKKKK